ncbi:hypothetical protein BUALT_Bualt09G0087500 [Buddleja alternifolia]|uniref:HhH-GPD domain-containing protein n=1 Tax=Buddleja alternifolia TaxID=168488 RepID=A0AAV6X8D5_9LAMI|nr:hypothetical protein BUALT_Bualt09G0087500 [Buddleja alternifolia]
MANRREDSKNLQIGCSWIPTTPAKPGSAEEQLICTNRQEKLPIETNWVERQRYAPVNHVTRANLSESGKFPTDFLIGGEAATSHVRGDNLSGPYTWQAGNGSSSHVYGEDLNIYDKLLSKDAEKWSNMSFGSLLALAHVGNTGNVENVVTQTDFVGTSNTFAPRFDTQIEGNQFTMSFGNSLHDVDGFLGAEFGAGLYNMPDTRMGNRSSLPYRPSFDLNSAPRTITDAAMYKNTSSHFEPITPEKTNKAEYRQGSDIQDLRIDEVPAAKDAKENKISRNDVEGLHEKKEQSQIATDQLQLEENHKPDKGGTEEADLIKTPQQKPRRKRHRPKVIIEGKPKRTPKASAEKTTTPQGTTTAKRKYVRRKGVENPTNTPLEGGNNGTELNNKTPGSTDTPVEKRKYVRRKQINKPEATMDKETTETTEVKRVRRTRSSCKRSLNFDSESQGQDESSSNHPLPNCNRESQAENFNAKDQSTTLHCRQRMEIMMEKDDLGIAYELTRSTNKALEDYLARPEWSFPSPSPHTEMDTLQDDHRFRDQIVRTRGKCQIVFSDVTHDKEVNSVQVTMNPNGQRTPESQSDSVYTSTCLDPERQAKGFKRQHVDTTIEAELCNKNATGPLYNSLQAYNSIFLQNANNNNGIPGLHFPAIYKKRRTDKGHNMVTSSSQYIAATTDNHVNLDGHTSRGSYEKLFTSTTNQGSSSGQCKATNLFEAIDGTLNGRQVLEDMLALGPTEWIKRKRSKAPTRLRNLTSLLEICKELPPSSSRAASTSRIEKGIKILHEPPTCTDALAADTRSTMTTKKRSKRGPPLAITWKSMSPIDSIIEQLNQLDLNAESSQASVQKRNAFIAYHTHYQDQYALVPYQRDGTVVPFDNSFHQVRRRKPRPKVDLDDETTKVWKLLLENINNEGIDGTDEEKTKWWEEERRIFNGRADSFIARMHLVQGDRRFSPWKGSVVDSVVGVFLTQNVSDHLSSSAFMSMAARFPLEAKAHQAELHEDGLGTKMKGPEVRVLDSDGTSELNKVNLNKSVCSEHTKMLQDFEDYLREVTTGKSTEHSSDSSIPKDKLRSQSPDTSKNCPVTSHETAASKSMSLNGDGRDTEDALCSQTSEISSQNSADSPVAQTTERSESCVLSTTEEEPAAGVEPNRFASSTSFVKLLQMAGTVLHGVYNKGGDKRMPDENDQVESESSALKMHLNPTFQAKSIESCSKSTLCHGGEQATEQVDLSQNNSKFFNGSSRKELCVPEISGLSSESASRTTVQKRRAASTEEEPKLSSPNAHSSNIDQIEIPPKIIGNQTDQIPAQSLYQENNHKIREVPNIPMYTQNIMDVTGSSSNINNSKKSERMEVSSNKNDPDYHHPSKTVSAPKSKGGRIGKQKQDTIDWDRLRKQAQPGGRERERTAKTMDSVDWDAVRCADVNEIAQTIKERGMNNMLAERIKDFLNRIVRDHGSIDLEWLRDVPPDKAKEYLLSFRGLGLKSVECVRLLTLHHLAFPVDTNVGRIAVRLGWVPLQPLPESLQLHLLELYPVLESIQKYLWPRLCKLDQRTLYELHYQMITFGKVFCTKSKPNCNACPMRAECRHFASAFASARLALPAPEEKSIVRATENKTADQNPMRSINTLQLPSPPANYMVGANSGVSNSQPIIEEPRTPEPIIEVPATPEPSYTQVLECDIENSFYEDPDEIPTIQLNMEEFSHNLQKIMQQNTELQEGDMSKALVALTSEAASIPVPKLKNVSRLRTEHQVYELPDSHPLLEGMDQREPDDPSPYLLAIWTPGETVDSIELPERRCSSQESQKLCTDETCSSCNSIREANSQIVRGTLLIPCRTAMRGSFPLNGTYFQVNEVFSDHESSLSPMDVPRKWLWNLPRRTVYFGTSIPTIFKGLSTEGIQYCFWRGFVCVRGFDRKTRAPRPLIARLHFPASRLVKGKGKIDEN